MQILVPASVLADLTAALSDLPAVALLPYEEEGALPLVTDDPVAVFRWVAGKRYEPLVLENASVRWLHTASAGVDHVLTPALRARGNFVLTDSGQAFGIVIGEYVLTWMLALAHQVPTLLSQQQQRLWKKTIHEELYGQTVGIIGLGPIGRGIAVRCRALGMRTLGLRRSEHAVSEVDETLTGASGLEKLLSESDWVVLAAAFTPETRHLIGAPQLALMKPSARLINIARGGLIDEPALVHALDTGRIAGAVLDVFSVEPLPADSPLWSLPNVIVTPHNSPGWTTGLRRRQLELFVTNVRRFVAGEPLEGVVNLERGY